MSVLITTEILGNHPLLTSANTNLDLVTAWVRSGDGLVGFGEYKRFEVKGEDRFLVARNWWNEQLSDFLIQNNVHGIGTGPILFSSFSFDPNEPSVLIIPEIVLGHKNGKSWITWIGNKSQPDITQISNSAISSEISWQKGSISEEKWREQVSAAITAIKSNQLEKVVLARDLNATSNTTIDIRNLMQRLEIEYPSTWLFLVDGLIGATPELLVRLNK
jgi:menaquinone-specific isochorismate synthase